MFSKATGCWKQNIQKQIDYKRPSITKQMNREHFEIQIESLKYSNRNKTR